MERTSAEQNADDQLEQAIRTATWTYHKDRTDLSSWVLTDYVVITAEVNVDGETAYSQFYLNGDCPLYRAIGLLEVAKQLLTKED